MQRCLLWLGKYWLVLPHPPYDLTWGDRVSTPDDSSSDHAGDDPRGTPMVSRVSLCRAGHRMGYTLCMALTVVMAMMTWALWHVSVKQAVILHLLNGGCLP